MSDHIKAHVWWSLYVKASTLSRLRQDHLPPITDALESLEFDWHIFTEEENPGLFRLVTYQNFECEKIDEIVIPVLRRAYKLANSWTIMGLDDLATGRLQHIYGSCGKPAPSHKPPALESLVFEVEPGRVLPMNSDGGWKVVDAPPEPETLKPGQIRRPKPPDDSQS
jgi:hypothetical protein